MRHFSQQSTITKSRERRAPILAIQLTGRTLTSLENSQESTDFSYYLTDGFNEQALGFFVNTGAAGVNDGQFASGHLIGSSGRNVFIVTGPEGKDLNGAGAIASDDKTIGIGNCYLSDYSVDLSVGSIPTVSVTMEGANVRADAGGAAIDNPSVDQEAGTPMAGTITLP